MSDQSKIGHVVENADIDRNAPQPQIHVEERRLTLNDFLKTVVKINGSDLHLQAGSIPMIRVDGRARFLDCPPPTDERNASRVLKPRVIPRTSTEHSASTRERWTWPTACRTGQPRFRTNIFHSREHYAIVMRRIVTKIPNFDDLNLPPQIEASGRHPSRDRRRSRGTTGCGKSHHAGGDHRQDQPHPRRAHHHRRRPDRISARQRQEPGQPGGSGHRLAKATNTPCGR